MSVGVLLGVLHAGGCAVAINPQRLLQRAKEDIAQLDLPVLAGEPGDLEALGELGSSTLLSAPDVGVPVLVTNPGRSASQAVRPGVAVQMLTSGTTGPPKRIDLTYSTLERVLVGAKHYESNRDSALRLRSGVAVVNSPLVHLGGLFRVLQCVSDGRPFSLLERFTVEGWLDAVRRHQPQTVSLVPAVLRMVLEADLGSKDLSSIRSVVSGGCAALP